jgi:hypothetical protein
MATIARNDPCPCGSGQKYKRCCMQTGGVETRRRRVRAGVLALLVVVAAVIVAVTASGGAAMLTAVVGLALVGGWFLFTDPPRPRGPGSPGAINFGR